MARTLLLIPVGHGVGLTSVSLGLLRALGRQGLEASYVKPVAQPGTALIGDPSSTLVRLTTRLDPPTPVPSDEAEHLLSTGEEERLLEAVVERFEQARRGADVVVVEGLVPSSDLVYSSRLNQRMASAVDAQVVLVGTPGDNSAAEVVEQFSILASLYRNDFTDRVAGCIMNRAPSFEIGPVTDPLRLYEVSAQRRVSWEVEEGLREAFAAADLRVVGMVPDEPMLGAPRVSDVSAQLGARVISAGEMATRRVLRSAVGAMTVPNFIEHIRPGTLVVTPGDRADIIMATSLEEVSGSRMAGLLLTGRVPPSTAVLRLCRAALVQGLPVLAVDTPTMETAASVLAVSTHCPTDDRQRAERVMNHIARHLDADWLGSLGSGGRREGRRLSPPAFRHQVIERAREANKRIVLPEGAEVRTVMAAAICQERGIARCVLLGEPSEIQAVASRANVVLPDGVEIVRPGDVIERYVEPLCELRRAKGLTPVMARELLEDTVMLGTVMLALDEVDGLVSGAEHTTASTIRPALQLIKTAPGASLVSSVFFMCLPDQVLVYGDCAVNPDPTAEQLAEIATQSAASAAQFGLPPRVAMLSYATGSSGAGDGVDKVVRATELARKANPGMPIDGPLQYDAAFIPSVGAKKAPDSPVAGRATVFIFPDLDAGNTTYKAVQRAAKVVSMGPVLQGLAKPVNDLSRGCSVEDVVYTIAITAVQATA